MATPSLHDASASPVSKRLSVRVRKQPEVYRTSASGKRKRSDNREVDDDNDRGMPEDYESEEEESEEEEEPDEEELREQRKQARKAKATAPKRPAQKKPKVDGASLKPKKATTARGKRQSKRTKPIDVADAEAVGGLYSEVFASGHRFEDIASEWLRRFDEHQSQALADLVNFVLKCAGCDGTVGEHDIEDPDGVTNKLDDLRDEYQATQPTEYPLIAKGKSAASLKQTITSFMHAVIRAIAAKGLIESTPELMENIQIWFSTMSSAPNPSFRHTATVVSLGIVSALCAVGRENVLEVANSQRHAETEKKKSNVNKARVKQLEDKVKHKSQEQELVEALLKDWFDIVFIHRYRDVNPLIRRDCVVAMGEWIVTMPDMFFDGHHLRYLGWVLSDTVPATRAEVIKQLHRLYTEKDMIAGLKTFTEKFRSRLVEIATTDAETTVRTATIELLDVLRENGLLEPDDIDAIGRLIFDTEVRIRKAVASFFSESVKEWYGAKIDELGGQEALDETLPELGEDDHQSPRLTWLKFKMLAEMLQSYDLDDNLPSYVERSRGDGSLVLHVVGGESRFTLAADVMYDAVSEMQEWQTLAGYLLFDHSSGHANGVASDALAQLKQECILTEKKETIMLEVLNASIKRTVTNLADRIAAPKSKHSKKARESLQEELEEAARHLAALIPDLLKKFGDVPGTAAAVLRIESVLNLPSLQEVRQDAATYGMLLDDVRKQFMSHGTDDVLTPASNAILQAKSYGELDDLTEEKVNALWDDVVNNLAELIDPNTIIVRGTSKSEVLAALNNNLLRIIRLAAVSNCIPPLEDSSVALANDAAGSDYQGAIDYVIALTQRAIPTRGSVPEAGDAALEDQIAARAAEAGLLYFSWKLKYIDIAINDSTSAGVPDSELEALATRRDTFVENLRSVLRARKAGDEVCMTFTRSLVDLFSFAAFLKGLVPRAGMSDDYTVLVLEMDPGLQKEVMRVFTAVEKNFAKLSGKRLEEGAGDDVAGDNDAEAMNEDPLSDPESDEEDDDTQTQPQTQTQASQQRKEAKMLATITAEQNLCTLVSRFVKALAAGVMDQNVTRRRLERNKAKLGPNYKACCEWLDIGKAQNNRFRPKRKGKSKPAAVTTKARSKPKSNAIIAEDELDDEIEDPDAEDEAALRRRELVVDEEPEPEPEGEDDVAHGADAEEESVLGD